MCGLFGFLKYGNVKIGVSTITEALAVQSTVRGTHAAGVAYNDGMKIVKQPESALHMDFWFPNACALIGHTRHATQGSIEQNYNNHPFGGSAGRSEFALAHNGVLINDKALRESLTLPKTKIETDSYIMRIVVALIDAALKAVLDYYNENKNKW